MNGAGVHIVWFNSGLSDLYHSARLIREAAGGRIAVIASHTDPAAPILQIADVGFPEPARNTSAEDYVTWALVVSRQRGVDLFIPSRHAEAISAARNAFAEQRVRVQVPSPQVLATLQHKDALYRELEGGDIPLPDYRVVHSVADLDDAYAALRQRHPRLCVKPTVGIYASGFRILDENLDDYEALLRTDCTRISLRAYRDALLHARRPFELMLMQYLDGPERSVDCLAMRGRLLAAVARRKEGRYQVVETTGSAIDAAKALVARYDIDGIVNVQLKDTGGVAHLLEINPRASGGLLFSCESGLNFPYWSAALALGLVAENTMPVPNPGIAVLPVTAVVAVPDGFDEHRHDELQTQHSGFPCQ